MAEAGMEEFTAKFEKLKKELRALCLSAGKNIYLQPWELSRDYKDQSGDNLERVVRQLGFANMNDFMWELDGDVFDVIEDSGMLKLKAVVTADVAHIHQLISRQSNKKNRSNRASRIIGPAAGSMPFRRRGRGGGSSHYRMPVGRQHTAGYSIPPRFNQANGRPAPNPQDVRVTVTNGSSNTSTQPTVRRVVESNNNVPVNHPKSNGIAAGPQVSSMFSANGWPTAQSAVSRDYSQPGFNVAIREATEYADGTGERASRESKVSEATAVPRGFDYSPSSVVERVKEENIVIIVGRGRGRGRLLATVNPPVGMTFDNDPLPTVSPVNPVGRNTPAQAEPSALPSVTVKMNFDADEEYPFSGEPLLSLSQSFSDDEDGEPQIFLPGAQLVSPEPPRQSVTQPTTTYNTTTVDRDVVVLSSAVGNRNEFRMLVEHDPVDHYDQNLNVRRFDSTVDPRKVPRDIAHPKTEIKWQQPYVTCSPDCGNVMEVHVTHVASPTKFYVRMAQCKEELESMMDDMDLLYDGQDGYKYTLPNFECLVANLPIALPFEGCWHRALVTKVNERSKTVSVLYVDYGTKKNDVKFGEVRFLPETFMDLPFQAMKASMMEIKPIGAEWSTDAVIEMLTMVSEIELLAINIVGQGSFSPLPGAVEPDGVLLMTLCDVRTDDDIYIHEQLVAKGLAVAENVPSVNSSIVGNAGVSPAEPILVRHPMPQPVGSPPPGFHPFPVINVADERGRLSLGGSSLPTTAGANGSAFTAINGTHSSTNFPLEFNSEPGWDSDEMAELEEEISRIVTDDGSGLLANHHNPGGLASAPSVINSQLSSELVELIDAIRQGDVNARVEYSQLRAQKRKLVEDLKDESPDYDCTPAIRAIAAVNAQIQLFKEAKIELEKDGDILDLD